MMSDIEKAIANIDFLALGDLLNTAEKVSPDLASAIAAIWEYYNNN